MPKKNPISIIPRSSRKRHREQSSPVFKSPLQIYTYMLKQGVRAVPVHYSDKRPIGQNWPIRQLTKKHFAGKQINVGLQLGEISDGLVDIDIDCEDANELAPYFLPETGWKRGHGPTVSGWLYKIDGPIPKYVKNCDPMVADNDQAAIAEFRNDNKMSVVFGLHPDGEPYELWVTGDPTRVKGDDLVRDFNELCAAVLLARAYGKGSRQDFVLNLAGAYAEAGRPLEDAMRMVTAIAEYKGDEELRSKRLPAIEKTYEKLDSGKQVRGWHAIEESGLFHANVSLLLMKWIGLGGPSNNRQGSTAVRALNLLLDTQLFSTPKGEAFATFKSDDHLETWSLRSKNFGNHFRSRYHETYGEVLDTKNLSDVIPLFEHRALKNVREVCTRVAPSEDATYIDLANEKWEVVCVNEQGWQVVADCPIPFRRSNGMLALPRPERGGSIEELRQFLNIEKDGDWLMMLAWIVSALRPQGPYPILALYGEQGTAKSTTARVLRSLIDPNAAPLRSAPRSERDLMITATNSWCLAFDNLSVIKPWFSDAMCRVSTGGGYATRELHTNGGEAIFDVTRPAIINSITDVAWSSDLIDRMVIAHLPTIPDDKRLRASEFWQRFEEARGRLFGALLDLTCSALRHLSDVVIERPQRMADFAYLGVAVEMAMGMEAGLFVRTYEEYRARAIEQTLESSSLAMGVTEFMKDKTEWSGKPGELLNQLEKYCGSSGPIIILPKDWPANARKLTSQLRKIAPDLRRCARIDAKQSQEKYGNSFTWTLINNNFKTDPKAKVVPIKGKKSKKKGSGSDSIKDLAPKQKLEA